MINDKSAAGMFDFDFDRIGEEVYDYLQPYLSNPTTKSSTTKSRRAKERQSSGSVNDDRRDDWSKNAELEDLFGYPIGDESYDGQEPDIIQRVCGKIFGDDDLREGSHTTSTDLGRDSKSQLLKIESISNQKTIGQGSGCDGTSSKSAASIATLPVFAGPVNSKSQPRQATSSSDPLLAELKHKLKTVSHRQEAGIPWVSPRQGLQRKAIDATFDMMPSYEQRAPARFTLSHVRNSAAATNPPKQDDFMSELKEWHKKHKLREVAATVSHESHLTELKRWHENKNASRTTDAMTDANTHDGSINGHGSGAQPLITKELKSPRSKSRSKELKKVDYGEKSHTSWKLPSLSTIFTGKASLASRSSSGFNSTNLAAIQKLKSTQKINKTTIDNDLSLPTDGSTKKHRVSFGKDESSKEMTPGRAAVDDKSNSDRNRSAVTTRRMTTTATKGNDKVNRKGQQHDSSSRVVVPRTDKSKIQKRRSERKAKLSQSLF